MKKLLGTLALVALTSSLFGQGQVQFNNAQGTGPIQQWTSATDSTLINVPKTVGTTINGMVEVLAFYNSTSATLTPLLAQVPGGVALANGTYATLANFLTANTGWSTYGTVHITSLQNGVFNDLVQTIGTAAQGPAHPVSYAILGWTGNYATFDAAYAADLANPGVSMSMIGISSIFTTPSADPTSTPPGVPPSISGTFTGMGPLGLANVVVPEPTSFALAGLGLAALLVFRRRS